MEKQLFKLDSFLHFDEGFACTNAWMHRFCSWLNKRGPFHTCIMMKNILMNFNIRLFHTECTAPLAASDVIVDDIARSTQRYYSLRLNEIIREANMSSLQR